MLARKLFPKHTPILSPCMPGLTLCPQSSCPGPQGAPAAAELPKITRLWSPSGPLELLPLPPTGGLPPQEPPPTIGPPPTASPLCLPNPGCPFFLGGPPPAENHSSHAASTAGPQAAHAGQGSASSEGRPPHCKQRLPCSLQSQDHSCHTAPGGQGAAPKCSHHCGQRSSRDYG